MKIIIVAHPSRDEWVIEQCKHLDVFAISYDHFNQGAASGHKRALKLAAALNERVVIMEDDAIPVQGFSERADAWCKRFPDELISFYLGTGRPLEWQPVVSAAVADAQTTIGCDFIRLNQLIHGVCYSIPVGEVQRVLDNINRPEADFAIGASWGKPVIYPVESLVEHRDGTPVEVHADGMPRIEKRVARYLAAPLEYST